MSDVVGFTEGKRRGFLAKIVGDLYISICTSIVGFLAGWYRTSGIEIGIEIMTIASLAARDKGLVSIHVFSHILIETRAARAIFVITSFTGIRGGLLAAIESTESNSANPGFAETFVFFASMYMFVDLISTVYTIINRDFISNRREFYANRFIGAALHVAAQAAATMIDAQIRNRADLGQYERLTNLIGGCVIFLGVMLWIMWDDVRALYLWIIIPMTLAIQGVLVGMAIWHRGMHCAFAGLLLGGYAGVLAFACMFIDAKENINAEAQEYTKVEMAASTPQKKFTNTLPPTPAPTQSRFSTDRIKNATRVVYNKK